MARYASKRVIELADCYIHTDKSVKEISSLFKINYKNVWRYMRKAVNFGVIKEEEYIKAYRKKNSLAKINEKNPNYNGKLVNEQYKNKISRAMKGKTVPKKVREKISMTKKNNNGLEREINKI